MEKDQLREIRQLYIEHDPNNDYLELRDFCRQHDIKLRDIEDAYIGENWDLAREDFQKQYRTELLLYTEDEQEIVEVSGKSAAKYLLKTISSAIKSNIELGDLVDKLLLPKLRDEDAAKTIDMRTIIELKKITVKQNNDIAQQLLRVAELVRHAPDVPGDTSETKDSGIESIKAKARKVLLEADKGTVLDLINEKEHQVPKEERTSAFNRFSRE